MKYRRSLMAFHAQPAMEAGHGAQIVTMFAPGLHVHTVEPTTILIHLFTHRSFVEGLLSNSLIFLLS